MKQKALTICGAILVFLLALGITLYELCHRKELNHSDRFWNEVSRILPDYKAHKQWLKDNGPSLIARI